MNFHKTLVSRDGGERRPVDACLRTDRAGGENEPFEPRIGLKKIADTLRVSAIFLSARRGSNPRPSPWQGDAIPLSHSRIISCVTHNARYTITNSNQKVNSFFKFLQTFLKSSHIVYLPPEHLKPDHSTKPPQLYMFPVPKDTHPH